MGFAQQVYGYGRKGDVFLGITTSGNSKNILYAAAVAKAAGLKVIGLTGRDGGRLKEMADACIVVPEQETFTITGTSSAGLSCPVPDVRGVFL